MEEELNRPGAGSKSQRGEAFSRRNSAEAELPPGRTLAPGRSVHDPIPVKVDAVALRKLREDVLPFMLHRVEAVAVPAFQFEAASAVGAIAASYRNVAIALRYTEESVVDVQVSRRGIHLKVCNIEAVVEDAEWSYEQKEFPYFYGSGKLQARALGGDVSLTIRCTQQPGGQCILYVDPEVVTIGHLELEVQESWTSFLYTTILGLLKSQIKTALEQTIENALRQSGAAVNQGMEWLAVVVLAVMHAEEDEAIAEEIGMDLMKEGKGRDRADSRAHASPF